MLNELGLWGIYVAYKVGGVCFALSGIALILLVIAFVVFTLICDPFDITPDSLRRLFRSAAILISLAVVGAVVSVAMPSKDDLKAAAAYAVGSKMANSEQANAILERVLRALEKKD